MGGGKVSANDDDDVIISQSVGEWCMEAVKGWNKMAAGCPEEENVFMCA